MLQLLPPSFFSLRDRQLPLAPHDKRGIQRNDGRRRRVPQRQVRHWQRVCVQLLMRDVQRPQRGGSSERLLASSGVVERSRFGVRCCAGGSFSCITSLARVLRGVTRQQALLDMWAAVHTSEAADAACHDLDIQPPTLHDDALAIVRCVTCVTPI